MSEEDSALVARVPALLEALRDEERAAPALVELHDIFLDGRHKAPRNPATTDCLLSAGLVPLLLSLCSKPRPDLRAFRALSKAACVSLAARDQIGLAGFVQLLGFVDDVILQDTIFATLGNTSAAASVAAAVCGEVGLPTLRRLFTSVDRSPSKNAFAALANLAVSASNADLQAFFDCGVVAWLDKPLHTYTSVSPNTFILWPILLLCKHLL